MADNESKYKMYIVARSPSLVAPALFFDWSDVQPLVKDRSGAFLPEVRFKSVSTYQEAVSFARSKIEGVEAPTKKQKVGEGKSAEAKFEPTKFYAVARSSQLSGAAIFFEWKDCQPNTAVSKGSGKKSEFKKWDSFDDAISFIKSKAVNAFAEDATPATQATAPAEEPESRRKTRIVLSDNQMVDKVVDMHSKTATVLFTDGACHGNGQKGARAGYGVWYGANDPRNMKGGVPGGQTNQRAELVAIKEALKKHSEEKRWLIVFTDSDYSAKVFSSWIKRWKSNGWKTAQGKPVVNSDLIEAIDELMVRMGGCEYIPLAKVAGCNGEEGTMWQPNRKAGVLLIHVNGHVGIRGNEMADALANEGVRECK